MLLGTISKIEDIDKISLSLKNILEENEIQLLLLRGELGAGKTTFTKSFLRLFDVNEEVTSPTFIYLKEYESKINELKISHYDLYRISEFVEDEEKLQILNQISFLENIENNFVIVEWPERIESLTLTNKIQLPKHANLRIFVNPDNSRTFELNLN